MKYFITLIIIAFGASLFSANWVLVPTDTGLSYDQRWEKAFYYCAKNYSIDVYSKENGYINSGWIRTSDINEVQLILLFSEDKSNIEFKFTNKVFQNNKYQFLPGRLEATDIKTDLMGLLGRVVQ